MLAKTHSKQSKLDRKAKKNPSAEIVGDASLSSKFDKADALVEKVYCDIANGVSRSQIIEKITSGSYDGMERGFCKRTGHYYYNAALDRFAVDTDIEAEKLRNMFYGRYEALLEECIKKGDMYNARGVLDSMSRIFGIERKTPDTAIMINSDKEGGVTVNFGFKKEDNLEN